MGFVLSNEMNYTTCSAELCPRLALAHLSLGLALVFVDRPPPPALNPSDTIYLKITQLASKQINNLFFLNNPETEILSLQIHLSDIMFGL